MIDSHYSAEPSHYDEGAKDYDILNEANSRQINQVLDEILRQYKVESVLDLTCGTGSQVFWLTKCGYKVTGSDINATMLNIAKDKVKKDRLDVKFLEGDMRTLQLGKFDAVITIFNAIGHLTKQDFEVAIRNIHENLKKGGLYIFDIFNLTYLLQGDHITSLTIDCLKDVDGNKVRKIQYSTIDKDGILASFTTSIVQRDTNKPEVSQNEQTLQVYSSQQLEDVLQKNGFEVIGQRGVGGSKFLEHETDRILMIARKLSG